MALQQSIRDAQEAASLTDLKALYRRYIDNPLNDKSVELCTDALNSPFIGKPPEGWNIGINDGWAAGRTIDHLHFQCIPRFAGDVPDPRGGIRHVIPSKGNYNK